MTFIHPDDWQPTEIDGLEPSAMDALRTHDRSVCVTASAGAGKTEFLAQKAAFLFQTGLCRAPKKILAISFKRDAARTLKTRVQRRCGPELSIRFDSLTFDAFTKRIVDQFRLGLPERYRPSEQYDLDPFYIDVTDAVMRSAGIEGLNTKQMNRIVDTTSLLSGEGDLDQVQQTAHDRFWRQCLKGGDRSLLSFGMVNRLAELVVRTNPQVREALRNTYPVVFIDELQDTTWPQMHMLLRTLGPLGPVYTAVGDDKQRIMGFAGALKNAFASMNKTCRTEEVEFLRNWRSHEDLINLQHLIAGQIRNDSPRPEPYGERDVEGDVCAVWEFDSPEDEDRMVAEWIVAEIQKGIEAEEIVVLVRMKVDSATSGLRAALAERGVVLRNVARMFGSISVQDLMTEPLTELLVCLLRCGSTIRSPKDWMRARDIVSGVVEEDPNDVLSRAVAVARSKMRDPLPSADMVDGLVEGLIAAVGESAIMKLSPSYARAKDVERVATGFRELLKEELRTATTWEQALDQFIGRGQVSTMTVHKAKGMEFHTVLFLGLDSSWRDLAEGTKDGLKTFYVAFTRARQRVFLTRSNSRRSPVPWFEASLT